ncbi:MAG: hypothetical protein WAV32_07145 [Halobacteriota archaeon]
MKVRVAVEDEEGMKTTLEREGDPFNEAFKSNAIRSIVKFLEDQIPSSAAINPYDIESEDLTIKERLAYFLCYDERAPGDWFTSSELKRIYEEAYGDNVKLSTLSTYLADMHSDGILTRKGSRARRRYKMISTTNTAATTDRANLPGQEREELMENDGTDDGNMEFIDLFPLREVIQH